jgi:hypothetical protein
MVLVSRAATAVGQSSLSGMSSLPTLAPPANQCDKTHRHQFLHWIRFLCGDVLPLDYELPMATRPKPPPLLHFSLNDWLAGGLLVSSLINFVAQAADSSSSCSIVAVSLLRRRDCGRLYQASQLNCGIQSQTPPPSASAFHTFLFLFHSTSSSRS